MRVCLLNLTPLNKNLVLYGMYHLYPVILFLDNNKLIDNINNNIYRWLDFRNCKNTII